MLPLSARSQYSQYSRICFPKQGWWAQILLVASVFLLVLLAVVLSNALLGILALGLEVLVANPKEYQLW